MNIDNTGQTSGQLSSVIVVVVVMEWQKYRPFHMSVARAENANFLMKTSPKRRKTKLKIKIRKT